MDEWEIPEEVLLFAASEDGMHQCFVINYGLSTFPEGAVLYVDTDPDGCVIPVAESVDAFLSKLSPYPDQLETVEDTERACQVVCVWGWVYRYLSKRSG